MSIEVWAICKQSHEAKPVVPGRVEPNGTLFVPKSAYDSVVADREALALENELYRKKVESLEWPQFNETR